MEERTRKRLKPLSEQMRERTSRVLKQKPEFDGDTSVMISTGSTLLDLAISGDRVRGGGIPIGIMVEVFGPSGSGKTVLLSEMAGYVQRNGGKIKFYDPEARLNKQFAKLFDLHVNKNNYHRPDTVPEIFSAVRKWDPPAGKVHGIFADSLAALSTDMEMGSKGDKTGMRRAKEFSEELRKTCRILAKNNYIMVCSNQVRQNIDALQFAPKYESPGGEAIKFYSSLRLRTAFMQGYKIKEERTIHGKTVPRVVGVRIEVTVHKSSVSKPYHTAPVTILFDYGIDDIKENLQFLKDYTQATTYRIDGIKLSKERDEAIKMVEANASESILRNAVIDLWEEIESKFESNRKTKNR